MSKRLLPVLILLCCVAAAHRQNYFLQQEAPGRRQAGASDSVFLQLKATYDKAMDERKFTIAAQAIVQPIIRRGAAPAAGECI